MIRQHLGALLDTLFADFTGIHFHIAWAPISSQQWKGHRFTCRLGVRNYWIPIRVRDEMLGIAYLQALEHPVALEREQIRLHDTRKRHLPPSLEARRRFRPASHPEQVVQRLLALLELNYGKRITLKNCARELGMNATYLSDLFSHTVGVPFKTYVTEHRIARAKELLSDRVQNLSEVAGQVGYASENRFRIAFKHATGLSPRVWRETLRMKPG